MIYLRIKFGYVVFRCRFTGFEMQCMSNDTNKKFKIKSTTQNRY